LCDDCGCDARWSESPYRLLRRVNLIACDTLGHAMKTHTRTASPQSVYRGQAWEWSYCDRCGEQGSGMPPPLDLLSVMGYGLSGVRIVNLRDRDVSED
jgi:hypothetical protein